MPRYRISKAADLERFWDSFEICFSGCWEWRRRTDKDGYGEFAAKYLCPYVPYPAHRFMWEFLHGDLGKGVCVLHRCDNPRCVNPDHLFLGTQADNALDRDTKGRGRVFLTKEQVEEIRTCYKKLAAPNGRRPNYTAFFMAKFGVSKAVIDRAARGFTRGGL